MLKGMENTIKTIEKEKIITIVRGVAREKLIPLAQAMFDGGIRLIECTYDASGKIGDEEIAANIKLLAVGGINEYNMKDFLNAGSCGIGIGSGIVKKKIIEDGDFEVITRLAKLYTERVQKISM